ncbi:40S ribosomal protein S10b [Drosophila eugracilis]|uniref:40S ribosomal protein S10b n=1 Tax=Drosophila eugracilis TaxID=29029 RepID=UPI0007E6509C|nr:40S ribosomal protein S10b [Drosophila eugracilis]
MFIPKANRVAIYEYLFKEGVIVAKKDSRVQKHPNLESIPNLHVIKAMQSLNSRGLVKEQFAWRHYYWCITNEGIEELRNYLHLPPEIVPSTLARPARTEAARPRSGTGGSGPRGFGGASKPDEDRSNYRRAPPGEGGADKKGDVGPGSGNLEYRGGFGRGSRY